VEELYALRADVAVAVTVVVGATVTSSSLPPPDVVTPAEVALRCLPVLIARRPTRTSLFG
jgi:hypothetical protein